MMMMMLAMPPNGRSKHCLVIDNARNSDLYSIKHRTSIKYCKLYEHCKLNKKGNIHALDYYAITFAATIRGFQNIFCNFTLLTPVAEIR